MKTADLYIRVSTDEQADRGYSQRNQEELLRKYCEINSLQVNRIIYEDHSAKTFKRPQWTSLLVELKKRSSKVDLILFTKWDRFSRNAGDAYQMISILRKLGVEPQAIEQPLDLSIPENKLLLAFYLAAHEVANDRRALNIFHGMRRAKKEGRWVSTAPIGYCNKITEDGRKYIAPKEPFAGIMKWIFETLAEGTLAADQVRQYAVKKGLKCSKNNFWNHVRNPLYCGKIFIPKFKDEEARIAQGLHEPLIGEALFSEVQDVLDGKKRKKRLTTKITSNDNLPFRGYLVCPKCNRMLTGSASKGRTSLYYYYHCLASCGCRFKAAAANEAFVNQLRKFKPHPAVEGLYKTVINNAYKSQYHSIQYGTKQMMEDIGRLNDKIAKGRELLLAGDIDGGDYRIIKNNCEEQIHRLEAKLSEIATKSIAANSIEKLLDKAISTLSHIDELYEKADIDKKREIIGSIFPEKICFDGNECRTTRVNEAVQYIYQINSELCKTKNRKVSDISQLSCLVERTGIIH